MKQADLRSARFGELMETLVDDPDVHEKVAHEMGWDRDDDEPVDEEWEAERAELIEEVHDLAGEISRDMEEDHADVDDPMEQYEKERQSDRRDIFPRTPPRPIWVRR